jgi:hypothetical protein
MTWEGSFSGLTGPAAHFHGPAEVGKDAAPAVWISEKGQNLASPFKGSATLTDAQADDHQKGLWYGQCPHRGEQGRRDPRPSRKHDVIRQAGRFSSSCHVLGFFLPSRFFYKKLQKN